MKLNKGLNQDFAPEEQPDGTYRWALNWLASETTETLVTEYSSELCATILDSTGLNTYAHRMTIIGSIPTPDSLILFSTTGVESEIGIYSETTGVYTPMLNNDIVVNQLNGGIASTTELNFSKTRQIKGIYRYNSYSELEIVFTDNVNACRLMYLPDINKDITQAVLIKYYDNYNVNMLSLFQTVSDTSVSILVEESGSLPTDSYVVFYRYKNIDGSGTSYYPVGEPLSISTIGMSGTYRDKQTYAIGSTTSKSIRVTFTQVAPEYKYIEVGIYRESTAELISIATIENTPLTIVDSTTVINITSLSTGITVSGGLSNLLAGILKYNTVKTITSLNQQLLLGGLSTSKLKLEQKWANTINLKWYCKWLDFAEASVDLKNPNTVYKTFQAGETYSFFIRGVKDEIPTEWCHISGRKSKTDMLMQYNRDRAGGWIDYKVLNEKQSLRDIPSYSTNDPVKTQEIVNNAILTDVTNNNPYYSMFDSIYFPDIEGDQSTDYNKGTFCYWENKDEPYTNYFKDDDLSIGDTVGVLNDAGNENVRHHKFPSYSTLQKLKNKYTFDGTNYYTNQEYVAPLTPGAGHVGNQYNGFARTFCSVIPQLGIEVDLSGIDPDVSALFDYFEVGYSKRSNDDCTVIATDIALFGQYRPIVEGFYSTEENDKLVASSTENRENAKLFTGGNFNNLTGATLKQTGLNGSWVRYKDSVLTEILPNRLHIHTPDLVDPIDFNNDSLGTQVQYVENEVLMSVSENVEISSQFYLRKAVATVASIPPFMCAFTEGAENLIPISNQFVGSSGAYVNWVYRNYFYMFDYTVNRASIPIYSVGDMAKSNIEGIIHHEYTARSDNWYPEAYKKQPVTQKSYVAANIGNTTVNGIAVDQGVASPHGIVGSSNHLHLVLPEIVDGVGILKPTNFSDPAIAGDSAWVNKSLIGEEGILDWNPTWDFITGFPSAQNYSRFMRKCVTHFNVSALADPTLYDSGDMQHNTFLTTLRKLKTSIYTRFQKIDILKTEAKLTTLTNEPVFYGDMFLSDISYMTRGNSTSIARVLNSTNYAYPPYNTCIYRFIAPTRKNINLRETSINTSTAINTSYPSGKFNGVTPSASYIWNVRETQPKQQSFVLANEFNSQNDKYHNTEVYKKDKTTINDFPFRIAQSLVQSTESSVNNWRSFPAANYYDIDKAKGYIVNLQNFQDVLLIHTNKTLLQSIGRQQLSTGDVSINIGTGGIFENPPKDTATDELGYAGTQHQHSCVLTPMGYVFADTVKGKVFLYTKERSLTEISKLGLFKYFRDYLKTSTDDFGNMLSELHIGYDYRFNRLLLTCKGVGDIDPFTVSFDGEKWVSFHSYLPDIMTFNSKKLYTVFGGRIYKHNSLASVLSFGASTYTGESVGLNNYQAELDYTANTAVVTSKTGVSGYGMKDDLKSFQSFSWRNQSYDLVNGNKLIHNDTISYAQVYNDHQLSEKITLNSNLNYPDFNVRQFSGMWNFNKFRDSLDRADKYSIPIFISNPNKRYRLEDNEINPIFAKRFVDKYAIIRFTVNGGTRLLKLIDVDSNFKKVSK